MLNVLADGVRSLFLTQKTDSQTFQKDFWADLHDAGVAKKDHNSPTAQGPFFPKQ